MAELGLTRPQTADLLGISVSALVHKLRGIRRITGLEARVLEATHVPEVRKAFKIDTR